MRFGADLEFFGIVQCVAVRILRLVCHTVRRGASLTFATSYRAMRFGKTAPHRTAPPRTVRRKAP